LILLEGGLLDIVFINRFCIGPLVLNRGAGLLGKPKKQTSTGAVFSVKCPTIKCLPLND
jgi:hypothetical protein